MTEPWHQWRTPEQNKLLQPACRDLARGMQWHGQRLSMDEFRWLICATVLGQKTVPGVEGGVVVLGGSSRQLNKKQATDAITWAFAIGDAPWEYDPTQTKPVQWGQAVRLARGIRDWEEAA